MSKVMAVLSDTGYLVVTGSKWKNTIDPETELEVMEITEDFYKSGNKAGEKFYRVRLGENTFVPHDLMNGKHFMPFDESKIIINRISTPDRTILTSRHVHDYQDYTDSSDGHYYSVDGGHYYLKRNGYERSDATDGYMEKSITSSAPFTLIRDNLEWGQNYDKDNNRLDETNWIPISEMTNEHIGSVMGYLQEERDSVSKMYLHYLGMEMIYRTIVESENKYDD